MSAPTDLWHISEGYEKNFQFLREESVLVLLIFSFCLFVRGSKLSCTSSTGPGGVASKWNSAVHSEI